MKTQLIQAIISRVDSSLASDQNHIQQMQLLWDKARKTRSGDVQRRIYQVYVDRAKEIIPIMKAKVKAEALGKGKKKTEETKPKRLTGGGSPKSGKQKIDPSKIDWSRTSDMDVLNNKIKYKE